MRVQFWLELYSEPTTKQVELVTQLISGWFMTGKMGGYNGANLQARPALPHAPAVNTLQRARAVVVRRLSP